MSNIPYTAFSLNFFIGKNVLLLGLTIFFTFFYVKGDDRAILCIVKEPLETPFFSFFAEKNSTCLGCLFPNSESNDYKHSEKDFIKYKSVEVIEASSESVELVIKLDKSCERQSDDNYSRVFVLVSEKGHNTIFTISQLTETGLCQFIFVACENVTVSTENIWYEIIEKPQWKIENVLLRSKEEFGFLTSFTNSGNSNKIILRGNHDFISSPKKCDENTKDYSPVATCSTLSKQVISGCYYQNRIGQTDNDVHIIDVDHKIQETGRLFILVSGIDTHVDSTRTQFVLYNSKRPVKRNLTLVICSQQPISLAVNVHNLEGTLTFLVCGNDEVENITPPQNNVTIAVKKVDLPESFDHLLLKVLSTVGLPVSYVRSTSSAVIKMIVPLSAGNENTEKLLKSAVIVECLRDHVVVSIARSVAERTGVSAMSLSDPSCFSKFNDSHLFLTSTFNACGFYLQSSGERTVYSNVVYIDIGKYSLLESDDEDFEEGSGWGSNFPTRISQIRTLVHCKLFDKYNAQIVSPGDYNYKISLYKDKKYSIEYQDEDFPITITANAHINVKLSLLSENSFSHKSSLRLLVEECWLSSSPQHILHPETLIRKSCAVQPFVSIRTSSISQIVHFQFKLSESAHPKEAQYLHCEIGLCSTNALPNPSIVKCVDPRSYCGKESLLTAFSNQFIASKRKNLVTGPLMVADLSMLLPADKEYSELSHTHGYEQFENGNKFLNTNQQPSIVVVEGLSTEAVVGIAILSFLLGIGLMGTLWFIYTKTDPGQHRRPESNVSMGPNYEIDANSEASTPSSEVPDGVFIMTA